MRELFVLLGFLPGCLFYVILLAKDSGIEEVVIAQNDSAITWHANISRGVSAICMLYEKKEVYFVSGKEILVASLSESRDPELVLTWNETISDLTLDWTRNEVYWSCTGTGSIYKSNVNGSDVQTVVSGINSVSAVAIACAERMLLYVTEERTVMLYALDKNTFSTVFSEDTDRIVPGTFHVDPQRKSIFCVLTINNTWFLRRRFYKGAHFYPESDDYPAPELENVTSMEGSNDRVVWVSLQGGMYTTYSAILSPGGFTSMTIIHRTNQVIQDVESILLQDVGSTTPCAKRNCASGCVDTVDWRGVVCTCPLGAFLGPNACSAEAKAGPQHSDPTLPTTILPTVPPPSPSVPHAATTEPHAATTVPHAVTTEPHHVTPVPHAAATSTRPPGSDTHKHDHKTEDSNSSLLVLSLLCNLIMLLAILWLCFRNFNLEIKD